MPARRRTTTSNFGVGRREAHDASAFYERFRPPEVSDDDTVLDPQPIVEPFVCGDARAMDAIADGSVALVVTSPPYFAGKQYEQELERDGVPGSYLEYLEMLTGVFRECARKLEPGGRIAVNVANLGRRPYRSLSADVTRILEQELGLLLRGELIWRKAEGASGSCAWGSFRSATNPVVRDVTERVIVASKGRFDRALTVRQRAERGLPHRSTLMADDFLALTLDVWSIPTESARRVGHPAPFPVELPEQLIRLYTFEDDLVLDPFMGSGSALVAAAKLGRRYIGYDLDPDYVQTAEKRVAEALADDDGAAGVVGGGARPAAPGAHTGNLRDAAVRDGKSGSRLATDVLVEAGFEIVQRGHTVRNTGVAVDFVATDSGGGRWFFDLAGKFTSHRGGLLPTDTVWRALGRAAALRGSDDSPPLVLLATELPRRPSQGDTALRAAGPNLVFDVIDLLSHEARERLASYAVRGSGTGPEPGFWRHADLDR